MPRYRRLLTEQANPATRDLDRLDATSILARFEVEDRSVPAAVARARPRLVRAARLAARSLADGGRLLLVGAGTSGRLAVLEAAEAPPTFGTEPGQVQALMAGGRRAVFRSVEGAEDDAAAGRRAVARVRAGAHDTVVGIAASGVTPYVRGALAEARRRRAATVFLTMNPRGFRPPPCDCRVCIPVGPEVLAGSTRLKAGTATKLALNALTTTAMVLCGRVYANVMVDVRPTSRKLRERALRLVQDLTGLTRARAAVLFARAGRRVKTAVAMQRLGLGRRAAEAALARVGGFLRRLIGSPRD